MEDEESELVVDEEDADDEHADDEEGKRCVKRTTKTWMMSIFTSADIFIIMVTILLLMWEMEKVSLLWMWRMPMKQVCDEDDNNRDDVKFHLGEHLQSSLKC